MIAAWRRRRLFFRMAVSQEGMPWPAKINVDGNSATHRGLRLLAAEDQRWRNVEVRARRYLNNVVEQDHRAVASSNIRYRWA